MNFLINCLEKAEDFIGGEIYKSAYPDAKNRWDAIQPTAELFYLRVTQLAVGIILFELADIFFRGFHHSNILGIYLCVEVLAISPSIRNFYNNSIAIPLYFTDEERANNSNKELAFQRSQKKLIDTMGKSSLIYRLYSRITSQL